MKVYHPIIFLAENTPFSYAILEMVGNSVRIHSYAVGKPMDDKGDYDDEVSQKTLDELADKFVRDVGSSQFIFSYGLPEMSFTDPMGELGLPFKRAPIRPLDPVHRRKFEEYVIKKIS